jgi:hypothetical protein
MDKRVIPISSVASGFSRKNKSISSVASGFSRKDKPHLVSDLRIMARARPPAAVAVAVDVQQERARLEERTQGAASEAGVVEPGIAAWWRWSTTCAYSAGRGIL